MARRAIILAAALALALAPVGRANAQNLVTNPGFETGSFSGWTWTGNTGATFVNSANAHSGTYAAWLGPVGSEGFLSQNIATTPGDLYSISFWLENPDASTNGVNFFAGWDGAQFFQDLGGAAYSYKQVSTTLPATAASTQIQFQYRRDPSYWHLDDVSVVDLGAAAPAVPEPGPIAALLGMGVPAAGLLLRRKLRA